MFVLEVSILTVSINYWNFFNRIVFFGNFDNVCKMFDTKTEKKKMIYDKKQNISWRRNTRQTLRVHTPISIQYKVYFQAASSFYWQKSWPVTFTNWARGEPSDGQSDMCVKSRNGQWDVTSCSRSMGYVCEINSGIINSHFQNVLRFTNKVCQ